MSEWIHFIHPPRDDLAATMTDEEQAVQGVHFECFERFELMLAEGSIILVGPPRGGSRTSTRSSPAASPGAKLRPFRVSLMRGRDG